MSSSVRELVLRADVLRALPVDRCAGAGEGDGDGAGPSTGNGNGVASGLQVPQDRVHGAVFSLAEPTPVKNPRIVAVSEPALALVGVAPPSEDDAEYFAECFSGNRQIPGSVPGAHCYCGYQFGHFSGQLGDGAAMYLGEARGWELQLKGSGPTKYSRQADGRKVLRSSLREFLGSEALHALGIPTTRAGCITTSDTTVIRDAMYDGNAKYEHASVVLRLAPTFLRFGSFEICNERDRLTGREGPSKGRTDVLRALLKYTIEKHFPEVWRQFGGSHAETFREMVEAFFLDVVLRTARLVASWQAVGFCHGVLNTDNMSIVGLTIDYGPFGFMDRYDPDFVCNGSDEMGRYRFSKQQEVCRWNCFKLAEALALLGDPVSERSLKDIVAEKFDDEFDATYLGLMRIKLGLVDKNKGSLCREKDKELVDSLLETMQVTGADYTNTFTQLMRLRRPGEDEDGVKSDDESYDYSLEEMAQEMACEAAAPSEMAKLLTRTGRMKLEKEQLYMLSSISRQQPQMIQAMGVELGWLNRMVARFRLADQFLDMTKEGKIQKDFEAWLAWLQMYDGRLREELKCTSIKAHKKSMMESNPQLVLRNWVAQDAIEHAEDGNYEHTNKLLKSLLSPFQVTKLGEFGHGYRGNVPEHDICVTCSS